MNLTGKNITSQLLCLIYFLRSVKSTTLKIINDLAVFFIEQDLASTFHDILTLYLIFMTIPVTVVSVKRSFSVLIKKYLRN